MCVFVYIFSGNSYYQRLNLVKRNKRKKKLQTQRLRDQYIDRIKIKIWKDDTDIYPDISY